MRGVCLNGSPHKPHSGTKSPTNEDKHTLTTTKASGTQNLTTYTINTHPLLGKPRANKSLGKTANHGGAFSKTLTSTETRMIRLSRINQVRLDTEATEMMGTNYTDLSATTCTSSTGVKIRVRLNSVLARHSRKNTTLQVKSGSRLRLRETNNGVAMIAGLNSFTMKWQMCFVSSIQSESNQTN